MLSLFIKAFITFFVVVAPIKIAPLFSVLTKHETTAKRHAIALRSSLIAAVVLLIFALVGNWLLEMLGISVFSFKIAGGFLLLILGVDMVFEKSDEKEPSPQVIANQKKQDIAVFPLSIPLIAGPATITSVILLTDPELYTIKEQLIVFSALMLVIVITYLCFLGISFLLRWLGEGLINVFGRILGIIVVALSFEMIIQGVQAAFGINIK